MFLRAAAAATGCPPKVITCLKEAYLQNFVHELTEANQGRAYYASLESLGEFIFEDYVRNRRKRVR